MRPGSGHRCAACPQDPIHALLAIGSPNVACSPHDWDWRLPPNSSILADTWEHCSFSIKAVPPNLLIRTCKMTGTTFRTKGKTRQRRLLFPVHVIVPVQVPWAREWCTFTKHTNYALDNRASLYLLYSQLSIYLCFYFFWYSLENLAECLAQEAMSHGDGKTALLSRRTTQSTRCSLGFPESWRAWSLANRLPWPHQHWGWLCSSFLQPQSFISSSQYTESVFHNSLPWAGGIE